MRLIISILIAFLTVSSCKKDKESCAAGTGGDLTLKAYPQHHSKTIPNLPNYRDTIYVKLNTNNAPGVNPANYDLYFVGNPGEDYVNLTGMKCGDYFLLGAGYDTTISQRVVGGVPFSTEQTEGEIIIYIPVTE